MRQWTYEEIKDKVLKDLDLQDEIFIDPDEMMAYANEAIDEAEAEILGLYEDYFLTSSSLALVAGTAEYSLPSDIYCHKIRAVIYRNGTTVFPIEKIRENKRFETIAYELIYNDGVTYKYIIKNVSAATGPQIVLYPAARETSAANVTLWYIRNANRMTEDASLCDIPEFASFIIQYMKMRCYEKEGHPNYESSVSILDRQRKLMIETLSEMVPDGANHVEMDFSPYEEMS